MANYGDKGWIKLWRKEMHNPLYNAEPFTKWQAWIDLCMKADDQGTVRTSLKALKNQWFWGSTHKVRDFLGTVVEMGLGTVEGTPNKGTLIRINTGFSEQAKKPKGTVKGTVKGIEEVLLKEVGAASSKVSHPTTENKNKSYNELCAEVDDDEYK